METKNLKRYLNLLNLLEKKSFFFLGPRSTGKTTLFREQLSEKAKIIDLLDSDYYLRLSTSPKELENYIKDHKLVVIDEVQKIPELLDEVHRLIEAKKITFLLTGSSARKLKANKSNLLAGRAWMVELFPLTYHEIVKFDLNKYLLFGGLPNVYLSQYPDEELKAYVRTYLYEEIRAEALVRKLPAFSRFLEVAALSNGQLINFTEIGNDCHVSPSTIREYYSILEDTLMGFLLPPWKFSKKRKAIQTAKFYFFDIGVAHSLARIKSIDLHSDIFGNAFEHFIGMELRAYLSYQRIDEKLMYWRSINGQEVDYVIQDRLAIEVKATQKVSNKHLKGLKAIKEEEQFKDYYLISRDKISQKKEGIHCMHWEEFLNLLWEGKIIHV